jgi:hypothetical protein
MSATVPVTLKVSAFYFEAGRREFCVRGVHVHVIAVQGRVRAVNKYIFDS